MGPPRFQAVQKGRGERSRIRPCANSSAGECCAELGRERLTGSLHFPELLYYTPATGALKRTTRKNRHAEVMSFAGRRNAARFRAAAARARAARGTRKRDRRECLRWLSRCQSDPRGLFARGLAVGRAHDAEH